MIREEEERTEVISVKCELCGRESLLRVRPQDMVEYCSPRNERRLIQDIFPYLTCGERELLISGFCDDCYKEIFSFFDPSNISVEEIECDDELDLLFD